MAPVHGIGGPHHPKHSRNAGRLKRPASSAKLQKEQPASSAKLQEEKLKFEAELQRERKKLKAEIEATTRQLDDPNTHYNEKPEIRTDLLSAENALMRLNLEAARKKAAMQAGASEAARKRTQVAVSAAKPPQTRSQAAKPPQRPISALELRNMPKEAFRELFNASKDKIEAARKELAIRDKYGPPLKDLVKGNEGALLAQEAIRRWGYVPGFQKKTGRGREAGTPKTKKEIQLSLFSDMNKESP